MYGYNPTITMDLIAKLATKEESLSGVERSQQIQRTHQKVAENLKRTKEQQRVQGNRYQKSKSFSLRDLVWIHLR